MSTPFYLRQDLTIFQGDQRILILPLVDEAGAPFDLTGYTFAGQVGSRGQPLVIALDVDEDPTSSLTIEFEADQTATLTPGQQYTYQVRIEDGPIVKTVLYGLLTVLDSLFEPPPVP